MSDQTITSRHYGVSISCTISSYPTCCGAQILRSFSVGGPVNKLTMAQKHEMYKELMKKIVSGCFGVLVATDAVVNFGPFANLGRSTSQWKKSDSAGDISLEDFCEYFPFTKSGVALNKNSGNLVASYVLALRLADEQDPSNCTVFEVEEPDFSDEPKTAASGDVEQIIAEINALLGEV